MNGKYRILFYWHLVTVGFHETTLKQLVVVHWIQYCKVSSELPVNKITVSSAYVNALEDCRIGGKSLTYRANKMGPNTDPCGTPHVTFIDSDRKLSISTFCFRDVR